MLILVKPHCSGIKDERDEFISITTELDLVVPPAAENIPIKTLTSSYLL
jgi:hypothetical protein